RVKQRSANPIAGAFTNGAVVGALIGDRLAAPAAAISIDMKDIVPGAVFMAVAYAGRRRGHADRRDFLICRTVQPDQRAAMIVAMKQKLGAFGRQYGTQLGRIFQAPKIAPQRTDRRMVDQDCPKMSACLVEGFG